MSLFLFCALVTAGFVAFFVFSEPEEVGPRGLAPGNFVKLFRRALRAVGLRVSPRGYVLLFPVFSMTLLLLLIVAAVGPFHTDPHPFFSWSQFLLGSWARQVVFGVIFGALFPIWVSQIYRHSLRDSWPVWLYVQTGAVLLFFVLGASGAFAPYLNRLTSIPTPWGPLAFSSSASNGAGTKPITDHASSNDLAANAAVASLANVNQIVLSDDSYLKLFEAKAEDRNSLAEALWLTIGAFAQCHAYLDDSSGDVAFSREQFGRLLPAMSSYRRLAANAEWSPEIEAATRALGEAMQQSAAATLIRAFEILRDSRNATDLNLNCAPLASAVCTIAGSDSDLGKGALCGWSCFINKCGDDTKNRKTEPDAFVADMAQELKDSLAYKENFVLRLKGVAHCLNGTPYLTLIAAGVAGAAGLPMRGVKQLEEWIDYTAALNSGPSAPKKGPERAQSDWYLFRVHDLAVSLLDDWIVVETNAASGRAEPLRLLRIPLRKAAINLLAGMPDADKYTNLLSNPGIVDSDVSESDFETGPRSERYCPEKRDEDKINPGVKLAMSLLTARLQYIDLVEADSEKWHENAGEISTLMRGLHLDMTCWRLAFPPNSKIEWRENLIQADIRRLEAKRILLDLDVAAEAFSPDERLQHLNSAAIIVGVARSLLATRANSSRYSPSALPADDLWPTLAKGGASDESDGLTLATDVKLVALENEIKARKSQN